MELTNQTYYHIKRKGTPEQDWYLGNRFNWNERENSFLKMITGLDLRMTFFGQKLSFRKANELLLTLDISRRNSYLFEFYNFGNFALNKTSMMLREVILENYRKENCPHLPSRYKSIWVCAKTSIDYWIKALQINEFNIYELKLTGKSHFASEKNLYSDVFNVNQYLEMAKNYWKENQMLFEDTEIIFDGEIEVVEILK